MTFSTWNELMWVWTMPCAFRWWSFVSFYKFCCGSTSGLDPCNFPVMLGVWDVSRDLRCLGSSVMSSGNVTGGSIFTVKRLVLKKACDCLQQSPQGFNHSGAIQGRMNAWDIEIDPASHREGRKLSSISSCFIQAMMNAWRSQRRANFCRGIRSKETL